MCELFGISSAKKFQVEPFLKVLISHSANHPHGWGMASFFDGSVSLEKEPKTAYLSDYVQARLAHPIYIHNMIAHIRLATQGGMAYENCHPFVKRDNTERAWTLAHNGTIFQSELLDTYRSQQDGSTDSERILCHIIHEMNEAGVTNQEERFKILDKIVLDIAEHNKINLMIFDGDTLYIHTNMAHTLYFSQREDTILFATVPLDDGLWEPVPMMKLFAYRNGKLVASGTQHSFEYFKPDPPQLVNQWL